jgi:putative MATE family efflux protein
MGLNGAAVASIAATSISLIFGIIYLNRKGGAISFAPASMRFDRQIAMLIAKIGFPSMLQQSAVSLGIAAMTSIINGFGAAATAAFGAAGRIDAIAFMPAMSIGMAVSAIAGQNLGAGKAERVHQTFRWGVLMTVCISAFLSVFFLTMPHIMLSAFCTDEEVIRIGSAYLRIVGPTSVLFAIMFVSNGIINGAGHTTTTLIFTLIAVWCIRVPAAALLAKSSLGITGVWCGFVAGFAGSLTISLFWYRTGRWKRAVIRHGGPATQAAEELPDPAALPQSNPIIVASVIAKSGE